MIRAFSDETDALGRDPCSQSLLDARQASRIESPSSRGPTLRPARRLSGWGPAVYSTERSIYSTHSSRGPPRGCVIGVEELLSRRGPICLASERPRIGAASKRISLETLVSAQLQVRGAPIDELDRALGLDGGDGGVDVLGDDVSTIPGRGCVWLCVLSTLVEVLLVLCHFESTT